VRGGCGCASDCLLGATESMWYVHKILQFENCLGTKLKTATPEILSVSYSRNYSEVSVQKFSLYFSLNIHYHSFSIFFFSIKGTASHPTVGVSQVILGNETLLLHFE